MTVRRGEIYWVELDPVTGGEQDGLRPAVGVEQAGEAVGVAPVAVVVCDLPPRADARRLGWRRAAGVPGVEVVDVEVVPQALGIGLRLAAGEPAGVVGVEAGDLLGGRQARGDEPLGRLARDHRAATVADQVEVAEARERRVGGAPGEQAGGAGLARGLREPVPDRLLAVAQSKTTIVSPPGAWGPHAGWEQGRRSPETGS